MQTINQATAEIASIVIPALEDVREAFRTRSRNLNYWNHAKFLDEGCEDQWVIEFNEGDINVVQWDCHGEYEVLTEWTDEISNFVDAHIKLEDKFESDICVVLESFCYDAEVERDEDYLRISAYNEYVHVSMTYWYGFHLDEVYYSWSQSSCKHWLEFKEQQRIWNERRAAMQAAGTP